MNKVTINEILLKFNICQNNEGRKPDYVMINPVNKENLKNEVSLLMSLYVDNKTVLGVKIIWTEEIGHDEIIFTTKMK